MQADAVGFVQIIAFAVLHPDFEFAFLFEDAHKNRRAVFEAGLVLQGWEVKSLRDRRAQLKESYIFLKDGEAWLSGAHISPMPAASTHVNPDPLRTRKLLLHRDELSKLVGSVERKGYTLVPLALYWKRGRAKLEIALVRGKKQYDKRHEIAPGFHISKIKNHVAGGCDPYLSERLV